MGLFLRKTKAVKILLYLLACFLILDEGVISTVSS